MHTQAKAEFMLWTTVMSHKLKRSLIKGSTYLKLDRQSLKQPCHTQQIELIWTKWSHSSNAVTAQQKLGKTSTLRPELFIKKRIVKKSNIAVHSSILKRKQLPIKHVLIFHTLHLQMIQTNNSHHAIVEESSEAWCSSRDSTFIREPSGCNSNLKCHTCFYEYLKFSDLQLNISEFFTLSRCKHLCWM